MLDRLYRYHHWANREALASIRKAGPAPEAAKLMAHIIGADWLWLKRLGRPSRDVAVWPELTAGEMDQHLRELERAWGEAVPALAKRGEDSIEYVNTKGERWSSRIDDVLTHVLFHAGYHRGQIATRLRLAGATPAYTDFIEATRRGYV